MKKLLLIALSALFTLSIGAQSSVDSLMQVQKKNCEDIEYNASTLIPQYLLTNDVDKAIQAYNFWKANCAMSENMKFVGMILDIKKFGKIQGYSDEQLMNTLLSSEYFQDFRDRRDYYYSATTQANLDSDERLFNFIFEQAESMSLSSFPENSQEYYFVQFVREQRELAVMELKKNRRDVPAMYSTYTRRVGGLFRAGSSEMSLRVGLWAPQGDASKLGMSSTLGLSIGGYTGRNDILEVAFDAKMGTTPSDSVYINYKDSVQTTDYISGIYVGMEYDRKLWLSKNGRNRMGVRLGLGYDHINVLPEYLRGIGDSDPNDNTNDSPRKHLPSINGNIGVSYHYRLSYITSVGLIGRYNYMNYINRGGSSLTGYAYSAMVNINFFMDGNNYSEAKKLGFVF
jgi:hypothetical protein